MLHDQCDNGALAPLRHVEHPERAPPVGTGVFNKLAPPRLRPIAVGHQGLQQTHRVGALAVTDRLDMGVAGRVEGRRDGHTVGEVKVVLVLQPARADDGFGVCAGQHPQPL
ncbi:Uncharacterised protein [Mycobacteroides abscessus subsp. massiliense]|nr:Uncharacterised protein [Mycobacteroides abscessus subsp. massiliense]